MAEVKLRLDEKNHGEFYITDNDETLGEMVVSVSPTNLTAHHTEVSPKAQGKGYAKQLLDAMVQYAREHHLHVIPLCQYVHTQFRRHPQEYADIWKENQR